MFLLKEQTTDFIRDACSLEGLNYKIIQLSVVQQISKKPNHEKTAKSLRFQLKYTTVYLKQ